MAKPKKSFGKSSRGKSSGLGSIFSQPVSNPKTQSPIDQSSNISPTPKVNTDFGMTADQGSDMSNVPQGMKEGGFIARGHGKVMDHKIKITKEY
jgi:hypothetical protein